MKQCSKCRKIKDFSKFRNDNSSKDGKKYYCRICDDEYNRRKYKINKEKKLQQVQIWQEQNPQKVKEYQKKYRFKKKSKNSVINKKRRKKQNEKMFKMQRN